MRVNADPALLPQSPASAAVIIPTHNRRSSLERALRALAAQTPPAANVEIIVVADGCEDGTAASGGTNWPIPVRIIDKPRLGPAAARNHGAAATSADLLIFLDDDIEVGPTFLAAHLCAHADGAPRRVAIGYLPADVQQRSDLFAVVLRAWWDAMFERMRDPGHRFSYSDLLSGNFSIRRPFFSEVGGFDESLWCHEDYELGFRLIRAGATLVFEPRAAGAHHELTDLPRALERKRAEGRADMILASRHPTLVPSLPICRAADRVTQRARVLRRLALSSPASGDRLARAFERMMPALEAARLRTRWRRLLDDLLWYWYWRGVGDVAERRAVRDLIRTAHEHACTTCDIELGGGLEAAARQIDAVSPDSVRLLWHTREIGLIPPEPGAERLRGRHLRALLQRRFLRQLHRAMSE